jgi:hypothetical protein
MEIDFPDHETVWDAPDPLTWVSALRATKERPTYRKALREFAGRGRLVPNLDSQSLWILLHSTISISWTIVSRDVSELMFVTESKVTQWKASLRHAFHLWEKHIETMNAERRDIELERCPLFVAGKTFAHMGTSVTRLLSG